jgi:hypothetical protein
MGLDYQSVSSPSFAVPAFEQWKNMIGKQSFELTKPHSAIPTHLRECASRSPYFRPRA